MYNHFQARLILSTILLMFLLNGCATIYKGEKEDVYFDSTPSAAYVWVNGVPVDSTPCFISLKSSREYSIEIKKDGYQTKPYQISNTFAWGWLLSDIIALTPLSVTYLFLGDYATGAIYYLDQTNINALLEKQK